MLTLYHEVIGLRIDIRLLCLGQLLSRLQLALLPEEPIAPIPRVGLFLLERCFFLRNLALAPPP
jgi:hypothetical protein